jgi:hypothetical protein
VFANACIAQALTDISGKNYDDSETYVQYDNYLSNGCMNINIYLVSSGIVLYSLAGANSNDYISISTSIGKTISFPIDADSFEAPNYSSYLEGGSGSGNKVYDLQLQGSYITTIDYSGGSGVYLVGFQSSYSSGAIILL